MTEQPVQVFPKLIFECENSQGLTLSHFRPSFLSARSKSSIFSDMTSVPKSGDSEFNNITDSLKIHPDPQTHPVKWERDVTPEGSELEGNASEGEIRRREFELHRFNLTLGVVLFLTSITTYLTDMGCDIYLVIRYFKHEHYNWALMTLLIVLIPAVITTSFSLAWYILDKRIGMETNHTIIGWTWRIFLHGSLLAIIVRLKKNNVQSSEIAQLLRMRQYELADSVMLQIMEGFMESAPQLMLQLYILFTEGHSRNSKHLFIFQYAACASSLISLAYCLTAYQIVLNASKYSVKSIYRYQGILMFYFWKIFVLTSRITALSLLATAFKNLPHHPWAFFTCILLHWIFAFGILLKKNLVTRSLLEVLFIGILAIVHCFDVALLKFRRRTEKVGRNIHSHFGFWYCLFSLENTTALILWFIFEANKLSILFEVTAIILVIVTFIFGMIFMLTYFKFAQRNFGK